MDGAGSGATSDFEDKVATKVGFGGWSGPEPVGFIRFENVGCGAVSVGIDSDGRQAELAAGAQEAQSDFATIGDENFAKHRIQGYRVQGGGYRKNATVESWLAVWIAGRTHGV